uniref:Inter-alpha-trypsin inhibitor heavy chain H3 n=1 Tax=Chrysemys picta bellii TaxID=8478 RepID=A0A8C3I0P6_CHRPI
KQCPWFPSQIFHCNQGFSFILQIFNGIDIYSMKIDSKVTSRFAHNVITSRAVNCASVSKEVVFFDVELPKMAFITNFSMQLLGLAQAAAVPRQPTQLLKALLTGSTIILTLPPYKLPWSAHRVACAKHPLHTACYVIPPSNVWPTNCFHKIFQIEANIFEPQGISELEGHVSFKSTIDQQQTCENCSTSFLDGDFTIKYDVKRDYASNLQIISGYFVHFFAPVNLPRVPKNVTFVIDISHSMLRQKMEQTKEVLLKILDDVKENDHFNFILFNNRIISWKEYLVKATLQNLKEAQKFVKFIKEKLFTCSHNIRTRGLFSIKINCFLCFNAGELNQGKIQENVKNAIQGRYSLYNLAFGYDMDYNFLEKMALENNGLTRRIYEDSDSALQLQSFYDEVANPMLREVQLHYPINATSALTQNNFNHYYDGSEIVVAGRIIDNDLNSFTADVKVQGANNDVTFTEQLDIEETAKRLWAYLTIQQLLEKPQEEKWRTLAVEALELSLKYKFVTPLTSMVVTKPEDNEDKAAIDDKPVEGRDIFIFLGKLCWLTAYKPPLHCNVFAVDGDPHFLIEVTQKKDHLCFNINLDPGVVLNLVKDPDTGITVNGQLIGKKKVSNNAQIQKPYIGKLGIVNTQLDLKIEITTEKITLQNAPLAEAIKSLLFHIHGDNCQGSLGWLILAFCLYFRVSQKDYGKDPSRGTIIPCWFIHNNGTGLIDRAHTNYIVSNLFSTPFIN